MDSQHPVLVYVEDDEASIFVMKVVVERVMGWQTLHVLQNSANFSQWLKELGAIPDLFLLDIHIEPHDGFELLSMLRSSPQFKKSKVVALTANVMNEEVAHLRRSGFDGAIAKPLNIDAFPDLIAKIMNDESVWYIM